MTIRTAGDRSDTFAVCALPALEGDFTNPAY